MQEAHDQAFDAQHNRKSIHDNVVFEPMSLADANNRQNVVKVKESGVDSGNYQKLSGDPEYFNHYYSDYFSSYYKNLDQLRAPFLEDTKNGDQTANRHNIMRYLPMMYNVDYNDNLLQSSSTLFQVNP